MTQPVPPAPPDSTTAAGSIDTDPAAGARVAGRGFRPLKLRTKLVGAAVLLVLLVCGITVVATQVSLTRYLTQQVDQRLMSVPRGDRDNSGSTNPATGETGPDGSNGPNGSNGSNAGPRSDPGYSDSLSATVVGGAVTAASVTSRQSGAVNLDAGARQALLAATGSTRPVTVTIPGYGDYRVLASSTGRGTTIIGVSLAREQGTSSQVVWTLLIAMASALAVAVAGAFLIVRRTLRPLDRVAATARQVSRMQLHRGEVDLGLRVPERDTDPRTEVGQVGAALNQMLGHVSTALERRHASEMQVRRFVADASHELRTPLAAIRGYTELARRGDADAATVTHALSRVDSESVRMAALVDDLLLLARLDAGRPLSSDEVDLTLLTMDVVSDARVAGPDHRWRLALPDEPVTVPGDGPRLHQVLANLLTNARTHTPPGTTVTTSVRQEERHVVLTVTDDGPGIDPTLLPGIFERFVRGDSSRSRQAGSTGLGLAIVRAVVAAHHGTVTADSSPGRTTFTVRLTGQPT